MMPHLIARGRWIRCPLGVTILAMLLALAVPTQAEPIQPVRMCAEWEPADGTLVRYPFGIPGSLVRELAADDSLFILVETQGLENQCRDYLSSLGVDLDWVRFILTPTYSIWTRDWGPHSVFDGDGIWGITDPIFDGYPWVPPGPPPAERAVEPGRGWEEDDAINATLAAEWNAPLHSLPAYCTGGNIMADGYGTAFSTRQMVNENTPLWTEAEFLDLAEQYLGITDYQIMNNTEDQGIQHIDCWAKLLDEETILVKRPPEWHSEYARIEGNVALLEAMTNCHGRPYKIVRIDAPAYQGSDVAAYTNSLILNKKVLVPLFDIAGDEPALQTYRDAMPGYEVLGFQYSNWYYYDALHCRTMAIFDRFMLRIAHLRLDAEVPPAAEFLIDVMIDDRSEAGLHTDELFVHWRREGETEWQSILLTATAGVDSFRAAIPYQPLGTTVEYYVAATDLTERRETLPRTAPEGFYRFLVTLDPTGVETRLGDATVHLLPSFPNPFADEMTIRLLVGRSSVLRIEVSDVAGRCVRSMPGGTRESGELTMRWDGRNEAGSRCAAGTYWITVHSENGTSVGRCLLVR